MSFEKPFRIAVPDSELELLRHKLLLTRFPDELENVGRLHGASLTDIKRLAQRWSSGFDWRTQEAKLNEELPQYTRDIDVDGFGTLNIHYVHKRSTVSCAIPLLFVHGWPGSFIEVRKLLPILVSTTSDHPSFHVVALSLPGFGFSEGFKQQGFRFAQYAEIANKLMLSLGYDEYVIQGGDWGYFIAKKTASMYGKTHVKAWHTNMPVSSPPGAEDVGLSESQDIIKELGYSPHFFIQSRQPQTIGYSLSDSPVGLLGWIYEKLQNWTDNYSWDDDEALTWISIYWFSHAGPTASLRIYYEVAGGTSRDFVHSVDPSKRPTGVPFGASHFPHDLGSQMPQAWTSKIGSPLVFDVYHSAGGHFAAYEQPDTLAGDLRKMFGKDGGAFGVVNGRSGY
ncbi:hypothetical protein QCA50_011852 [Cerrena zonata]|uniref:Epoxide hydrolase N-terminal domain-containing protein n=1 Tax=Cerrena zonata TaxID=2478898 RepID=A0AAW0G5S7_9APHY